MNILQQLVWVLILLGSFPVFAADDVQTIKHIPNEYESVGGHALGLGNAGVAALGGVSAIRMNPGLLPLEPEYTLSMGYQWPTSGRKFFQAAVVDSVTSSIAAGVTMNGFDEKYEDFRQRGEVDAPMERRVTLAFGKAFRRLALGINGEYVVGYQQEGLNRTQQRGVGVGLGVAGLLTDKIRVGASAENLHNKDIESYSPTIFRAGLAYLMLGGAFSAHVDYRQRQRIDEFEGETPSIDAVTTEKGKLPDEKMVMVSASARIYDVLRLLAGYGSEMGGEKRKTVSGGIGLVHKTFSLTFNVSRPYLAETENQSNINLNLTMAM